MVDMSRELRSQFNSRSGFGFQHDPFANPGNSKPSGSGQHWTQSLFKSKLSLNVAPKVDAIPRADLPNAAQIAGTKADSFANTKQELDKQQAGIAQEVQQIQAEVMDMSGGASQAAPDYHKPENDLVAQFAQQQVFGEGLDLAFSVLNETRASGSKKATENRAYYENQARLLSSQQNGPVDTRKGPSGLKPIAEEAAEHNPVASRNWNKPLDDFYEHGGAQAGDMFKTIMAWDTHNLRDSGIHGIEDLLDGIEISAHYQAVCQHIENEQSPPALSVEDPKIDAVDFTYGDVEDTTSFLACINRMQTREVPAPSVSTSGLIDDPAQTHHDLEVKLQQQATAFRAQPPMMMS